MAKRLPPDEFKRNETVKTLDALPGVPQGTTGRLYLVDGFAWTRYRVLFDNGVDVGSLDGSSLARPRDYEAALERRGGRRRPRRWRSARRAPATGTQRPLVAAATRPSTASWCPRCCSTAPSGRASGCRPRDALNERPPAAGGDVR